MELGAHSLRGTRFSVETILQRRESAAKGQLFYIRSMEEPESQAFGKATRHDSEVVAYSRGVLEICKDTKLYVSATTKYDLDSSYWRNIFLQNIPGHLLIEPTTEVSLSTLLFLDGLLPQLYDLCSHLERSKRRWVLLTLSSAEQTYGLR